MNYSIKVIFEGSTGCGKTYTAIKKAKELGSFIYLAPCRQLVYEVALDYGSIDDIISTGEVSVGRDGNNMFAVYESATNLDITAFKTVIIDEAHFITDSERNGILLSILSSFAGNIFLLTATRTFRAMKGFKIKKLKPFTNFKKIKINKDSALARMRAGVPTIVFRKFKGDCGNYGGAVITADTPPAERLATQLAFKRGEITLVECTNVLAQGLNFPCENVIIEYNNYDSSSIIKQKLGRLGRHGITAKNCVLTYAVYVVGKIPKKIKLQDIKTAKEVVLDISNEYHFLKNIGGQPDNLKIVLGAYIGKPEHEFINLSCSWYEEKEEITFYVNRYNFKSYEVLLKNGVNFGGDQKYVVDRTRSIADQNKRLEDLLIKELNKKKEK